MPNFVRSKSCFNILFWFGFITSSIIASSFYVYLSILAYFEYDVVTIYKTGYDQPAELPTVTLCSRALGKFDNLSQLQIKEIRFGYDNSLTKDPFNHLETFYNKMLGRCFRFNSGKNLNNHSIPIKKSTFGGRDDCFAFTVVDS